MTAAETQKRYSDTIERAIAEAGRLRERITVEATDGAEAYAYPHQRGIAWGANAAETGVNILRGVRRPDGTDEAVTLSRCLPRPALLKKREGFPALSPHSVTAAAFPCPPALRPSFSGLRPTRVVLEA